MNRPLDATGGDRIGQLTTPEAEHWHGRERTQP